MKRQSVYHQVLKVSSCLQKLLAVDLTQKLLLASIT